MPHGPWTAVCLTLLCLLPGSVEAQPLTTSTGELGNWLDSGERVIVTGRVPCGERDTPRHALTCVDGWARRTVKGRLDLHPDRLVVVRGDDRYMFPLDAIEVVQRPNDRIWNGALIGYAAGFAPFGLMELDCSNDPGCWQGLPTAVGLLIAGPIGFGVGALTDALIHRPQLVFARSVPPVRASVAPMLSRGAAGVRVSLAF